MTKCENVKEQVGCISAEGGQPGGQESGTEFEILVDNHSVHNQQAAMAKMAAWMYQRGVKE